MLPNPQLLAALVAFTEEIFNGKLHFLCNESLLAWLNTMRCYFIMILHYLFLPRFGWFCRENFVSPSLLNVTLTLICSFFLTFNFHQKQIMENLTGGNNINNIKVLQTNTCSKLRINTVDQYRFILPLFLYIWL